MCFKWVIFSILSANLWRLLLNTNFNHKQLPLLVIWVTCWTTPICVLKFLQEQLISNFCLFYICGFVEKTYQLGKLTIFYLTIFKYKSTYMFCFKSVFRLMDEPGYTLQKRGILFILQWYYFLKISKLVFSQNWFSCIFNILNVMLKLCCTKKQFNLFSVTNLALFS